MLTEPKNNAHSWLLQVVYFNLRRENYTVLLLGTRKGLVWREQRINTRSWAPQWCIFLKENMYKSRVYIACIYRAHRIKKRGCLMAVWLHNHFYTMFSLCCWSDPLVGHPDCLGAARARVASMAAGSLLTASGGIMGGLEPAWGACPSSTHLDSYH